MVETKIRIGSDEVTVESGGDITTIGFRDYDSPVYGLGAVKLPRPQLRALIEALRQADAETRTKREIVVRHEQGVTEAFGLHPGIIEEEKLLEMTESHGDSLSRMDAERWAHEVVQVGPWELATVYFHGFPDEPTDG
jgi:hypothetical protein